VKSKFCQNKNEGFAIFIRFIRMKPEKTALKAFLNFKLSSQ
jgi:hypothetical protein